MSGELADRWLTVDPTVERLDLDEASWIDVARRLVPCGEEAMAALRDTIPWSQGQVYRYERWIESPRLMAAYEPGRHPAVDAVDAWLRRRYAAPFGRPVMSLYRDERDSVAYHRDRELRWLDDTLVAVLTFGAQRPWLVKPVTERRYPVDEAEEDGVLDFAPRSGDPLVMGGETQLRWLHAVPKVRGRTRPRISVQWRYTTRRGKPDTAPGFYEARHFSK